MIPPVPPASYEASGWVITSIFLIVAAGIVDKSVAVVGTPSRSTKILAFPRMEMTSFATLTADDERSMSIAVPVLEAMFAEAWIVVCSIDGFCITSLAETTTSPNEMALSFRTMVPNWMREVFGASIFSYLLYPTNSIASLYA